MEIDQTFHLMRLDESQNYGGHGAALSDPLQRRTWPGCQKWAFISATYAENFFTQSMPFPMWSTFNYWLKQWHKVLALSAQCGNSEKPYMHQSSLWELSRHQCSLTFPSSPSCSLPLLSTVADSNKYSAQKTPAQHLFLENPTYDKDPIICCPWRF